MHQLISFIIVWDDSMCQLISFINSRGYVAITIIIMKV